MRSIHHAGLSVSLLVPLALLVSACDVTSGGESEGPFGENGDAVTCGATQPVDLPKGAVLLTEATGGVIAVSETPDPNLKVALVSATKYTCACNAPTGECVPNLDPVTYKVNCVPSGCAMEQGGDCSLKTGLAAPFEVVKAALRQKACGTEDAAVAQARVAQVDAWIAQNSFQTVQFDKNGDVTAPAGYGLVAELVGGAWLVYAVPGASFDKNGNLATAVGPVAGDPVQQLAAGGGASCYCDKKGSKKACQFSGGSSGLCTGQCKDVNEQSLCTISIR